MIVALSHARDVHAAPVLDALRRAGQACLLLDLADFPRRAAAVLEYGAGGRGARLELPGGSVDAGEIRAVWWRRPLPFEVDPRLAPAHGQFAFRQTREALGGLAAQLEARWVNDPWREAAAEHKAYQLAVAERVGLAVPRTLVTNAPERARAFLEAQRGPAVHKPLHIQAADWRPTRLVGPGDLARLDDVRLAPVMFQEYVPGIDVRVTAVGEALFAVEIDARRTSSPEDFRPVLREAPMSACELPPPVAARLRELLRRLGLAYAAVDLRRRDDGAWVFLEANPSGQWLFVEERTGLPITAAVAALLAGG